MTRLLAILITAFALGGAGLWTASRRAGREQRRARAIKYTTYLVIVFGVTGSALAGSAVFASLVALIVLVGGWELARALRYVSGGRGPATMGYLVIGTGAVFFALWASPTQAALLYLCICAFDGFSQVAGQLIGKRGLAPAISPAKTVEGTLGGLVAATLVAALVAEPLGIGPLRAALTAPPICFAGLTGDLLASWIKRRAGIKDFSQLIPGHGGFLDRFDSWLFASACAALWMASARLA